MNEGPQATKLHAATAKSVAAVVYASSQAAEYGLSLPDLERVLAEVAEKYCAAMSAAECSALLNSLRHQELALARGCAAGHEKAWEVFLTRFRSALYGAAYGITRSDAEGRELADSLYAELYGLDERDGRRRSKLLYYMGRGSLEGWLRTVLAQDWITRKRRTQREVSLEEQVEAGRQFEAAAPSALPAVAPVDAAVTSTLAALAPEERFLLVAYFLDGRTLAQIALVQRVHESTISRKLERLVGSLRKEIRKHLVAQGLSAKAADEALEDVDVRDLQVKVRENLRQETPPPAF